MLKNPAVSEHKCFLQSTVHNIQRHLSCKIDTFFARHAAARQRQWRRLLLNLWRNFDGGSLASTPVWMIYTLILQSCTLSFVNFLSKNLILFAVKPNRKEMEPISVYCSVRKLIASHSSLVIYLQVNNYEIVLKFFHISHNLKWNSAIIHKYIRIYPFLFN